MFGEEMARSAILSKNSQLFFDNAHFKKNHFRLKICP